MKSKSGFCCCCLSISFGPAFHFPPFYMLNSNSASPILSPHLARATFNGNRSDNGILPSPQYLTVHETYSQAHLPGLSLSYTWPSWLNTWIPILTALHSVLSLERDGFLLLFSEMEYLVPHESWIIFSSGKGGPDLSKSSWTINSYSLNLAELALVLITSYSLSALHSQH